MIFLNIHIPINTLSFLKREYAVDLIIVGKNTENILHYFISSDNISKILRFQYKF